MTTLQIETLDAVRGEIEPLLHAHYAEIATDKSVKPLDIDWDGYYALEDSGFLRIMTARTDVQMIRAADDQPVVDDRGIPVTRPGWIVGYFVSFISPSLHYAQTKVALNDIFYVSPECRGSTLGYRLLREAAADLKNLNCDILTVHMKVAHPFRNLLIKQGFTLTEENWDKVL